MKELSRIFDICKTIANSDTAYDASLWNKNVHPLKGHCGCVAYVIHREFGGNILTAKVNGETHYWNLLPCGMEIDLTGGQFSGKDDFKPLIKGRIVKERKNVNLRFLLFEKRFTTLFKSE